MTGILGGHGRTSTSSYPRQVERRRRLQVSMRHVIVTSGPGAGKTALLAELAAMGYPTTVEESRAGHHRRTPCARCESSARCCRFRSRVLRRDIEKALPRVFFDRGLIDSLGMLHEASPLSLTELGTHTRFLPVPRRGVRVAAVGGRLEPPFASMAKAVCHRNLWAATQPKDGETRRTTLVRKRRNSSFTR